MHINGTMSLLGLNTLKNNPAYELWNDIYHCLYDVRCDDLNNKYLLNDTSILLV